MAKLRELTQKTVRTLREDGFQKVGEKAKIYLKRIREEKVGQEYTDRCFREVLFINGCDEHLPHPGRYRVTHQREQLESLGITTGEVYYRYLKLDTVRCYRTFVFFRCPYTPVIGDFVEQAHKLNKKVFYDVDDLVIDTAYTDMIAYLDTLSDQERQEYDQGVREMGRLLRLCDGAITTTGCLAHELEQYVPRVLVNRNVASEEMVKLSLEAENRAKKKEKEEGAVSLGYFSGSITHDEDFQMILPVLRRLMEEYPGLQLHLAGELHLPPELEDLRERILVHPFVGWRELPAMIAEVDINLAPLTTTTFNRAKSENKWVEAALVKVPTVASDIGAFHEMVENGKTGILCQNLEQWEEALRALVQQPDYRALIGEAAREYCLDHCVTANTGQELGRFLTEQEPKSVAFLLPAFQISGGVMVALQHCRILQEAGWDVLLYSIEERGREYWYEFGGCRFPVLNGNDAAIYGKFDWAVATMWSTVDWLEAFPRVKHRGYLVQNYEPGFYASGDPLRMRARKTYGCREDLQYLTISQWCQRWLKEQYGHEARYAPNGIDPEKFLPAPRNLEETSGEKIRILIEGDSAAPHKNVDESFRIVEKLDPERFEVWYMAYSGEPKDWYRVDRFLPKVPYDQIQEVYQDCDILLKSSLMESFSYPPLEMMAAGGFVVAVLNGGNQEYLEDGGNCLCYQPGDIDQAVQAILHICGDRELQDKFYQNGHKTVMERDWKQIRESILNLYQ